MLGEQIGQDKGKVTTRRVLANDNGPRVEVSFECAGQLLGLDHKHIGTYDSTIRPDGTLYGEGQGVVMTTTGEQATWKGNGVGKFNDDGSMSFRGSVIYFSTSDNLKRLNTVAVIYEHEVTADGEIDNKMFEWR